MPSQDLVHTGSPESPQDTLIHNRSLSPSSIKKRRAESPPDQDSSDQKRSLQNTASNFLPSPSNKRRRIGSPPARDNTNPDNPAPDKLDPDDPNLTCLHCGRIFNPSYTPPEPDLEFDRDFVPEPDRRPALEFLSIINPAETLMSGAQTVNTTRSVVERKTADDNYRVDVLQPKGINLLLVANYKDDTVYKHHMPAHVRKLVEQVLYENNPFGTPTETQLPKDAEMATRCRRLFESLNKRQICLIEESVKDKLAAQIAPLSLGNIDLAPDILDDGKVSTFTSSAMLGGYTPTPPDINSGPLPGNFHISPFLREVRMARPIPDMIYGYLATAFPDARSSAAELQMAYCNGENIMFPYLAVEYKPQSGNPWHTANQCLGDMAVSLRQTENIVGFGQCMFCVCINDDIADIYIAWSTDTPIDSIHTIDNIDRYYYMMRLRRLVISESSQFIQFWKILINIHRWGATDRYKELSRKLSEYLGDASKSL
ncbi:hypothetical protein F5B19DRAFT_450750 [Rostrohypoxylon terebratum]|nr:hypothetical protein F5B19DRAFT_450750 [Rostrohypoxylon terebratum]